MTKDKDKEKAIKRISVALPLEVYEGVKALAAVTADSITDYVAAILANQVSKNKTVVQQVKLARRTYEELILNAAADETKKAAE